MNDNLENQDNHEKNEEERLREQQKHQDDLNKKNEDYQRIKDKYFEYGQQYPYTIEEEAPKPKKPTITSKLTTKSSIFDPEFIRPVHEFVGFYHREPYTSNGWKEEQAQVKPPPGLFN